MLSSFKFKKYSELREEVSKEIGLLGSFPLLYYFLSADWLINGNVFEGAVISKNLSFLESFVFVQAFGATKHVNKSIEFRSKQPPCDDPNEIQTNRKLFSGLIPLTSWSRWIGESGGHELRKAFPKLPLDFESFCIGTARVGNLESLKKGLKKVSSTELSKVVHLCICEAARKGNFEVMDYLVREHKVNFASAIGYSELCTPPRILQYPQNSEIFFMVLIFAESHDGNINSERVFHMAIKRRSIDAVLYLHEKYQIFSNVPHQSTATFITEAIACHDFKIAKLLIDLSADNNKEVISDLSLNGAFIAIFATMSQFLWKELFREGPCVELSFMEYLKAKGVKIANDSKWYGMRPCDNDMKVFSSARKWLSVLTFLVDNGIKLNSYLIAGLISYCRNFDSLLTFLAKFIEKSKFSAHGLSLYSACLTRPFAEMMKLFDALSSINFEVDSGFLKFVHTKLVERCFLEEQIQDVLAVLRKKMSYH